MLTSADCSIEPTLPEIPWVLGCTQGTGKFMTTLNICLTTLSDSDFRRQRVQLGKEALLYSSSRIIYVNCSKWRIIVIRAPAQFSPGFVRDQVQVLKDGSLGSLDPRIAPAFDGSRHCRSVSSWSDQLIPKFHIFNAWAHDGRSNLDGPPQRWLDSLTIQIHLWKSICILYLSE